eukprot:4366258-Pleurochrysis_carterae.AAC.1
MSFSIWLKAFIWLYLHVQYLVSSSPSAFNATFTFSKRFTLKLAPAPSDLRNYRNSRSKAARGPSRPSRPTVSDHARLSWRVLPF